MPAIEFSRTHSYLPADDGISLPVILNNGGAAGNPMAFRTATGRVEAFGHLVTIETLGLNFESVVYFFADERINKNLLGRLGWLDRIRLGLIDHDGLLYVAPYD